MQSFTTCSLDFSSMMLIIITVLQYYYSSSVAVGIVVALFRMHNYICTVYKTNECHEMYTLKPDCLVCFQG